MKVDLTPVRAEGEITAVMDDTGISDPVILSMITVTAIVTLLLVPIPIVPLVGLKAFQKAMALITLDLAATRYLKLEILNQRRQKSTSTRSLRCLRLPQRMSKSEFTDLYRYELIVL